MKTTKDTGQPNMEGGRIKAKSKTIAYSLLFTYLLGVISGITSGIIVEEIYGKGLFRLISDIGELNLTILTPEEGELIDISPQSTSSLVFEYSAKGGVQPVVFLDGIDITKQSHETTPDPSRGVIVKQYAIDSFINKSPHHPGKHMLNIKLERYSEETDTSRIITFGTCYYDSLCPYRIQDWLQLSGKWTTTKDYATVGKPLPNQLSATMLWKKFIEAGEDYSFSFYAKILSMSYLGGISAVLNSEYEVIFGDGVSNNVRLKRGTEVLASKTLPKPLTRGTPVTVRIERIGDDLTVYLDNITVLTYTDQWPPASTHTEFGVRVWKSEIEFRDARLGKPMAN